MMKRKKSSTTSTKWLPFATKLTLSKLCRYLALAVMVKLAVFFSLAVNIHLPVSSSAVPENLGGGIAVVSPTPQPILSQAMAQSNATAPAANATAPAPAVGGDAMTRDILSRRAADLDRREQELNKLEQTLNEKIVNMQAMEARIQTMLKEAKTLQSDKMKHLIDVYTNMKAQQAATVLETLDERTSVQILAGMRGRQAGEILTYMKPEKAARLSEMLSRIQMPFQ